MGREETRRRTFFSFQETSHSQPVNGAEGGGEALERDSGGQGRDRSSRGEGGRRCLHLASTLPFSVTPPLREEAR